MGTFHNGHGRMCHKFNIRSSACVRKERSRERSRRCRRHRRTFRDQQRQPGDVTDIRWGAGGLQAIFTPRLRLLETCRRDIDTETGHQEVDATTNTRKAAAAVLSLATFAPGGGFAAS